jgi:hypothetical protein
MLSKDTILADSGLLMSKLLDNLESLIGSWKDPQYFWLSKNNLIQIISTIFLFLLPTSCYILLVWVLLLLLDDGTFLPEYSKKFLFGMENVISAILPLIVSHMFKYPSNIYWQSTLLECVLESLIKLKTQTNKLWSFGNWELKKFLNLVGYL